MTADFKTLAAQFRDLQDASKAQIAGVLARAEEAGIDPAGLRRFVAWKRKNEEKRAQQEAIDQQCRYLAGERDTPAQLPIGCELAQALNLYRRGLTVCQVAEELRVSTGKAGKLKQLSRMFDVHVHPTVDKMPPHDPVTGEITDAPPAGGASAVEMGQGTPDAGTGGATEVETVLIDGLGVSGEWRERVTGSATVVATGNLDALSPIAAPLQASSHSTGDDFDPVRDMPAGLRRTPTVRA